MNVLLIVVIGNIEEKYKNTRHNIDFIMLDFFAMVIQLIQNFINI